MMIYNMALVTDKGTHFEINGVTTNVASNIKNKEEHYLNLSSKAAEIIKEALNSGNNRINVYKPLKSMEVLPGEVIIEDIDPEDIRNVKSSEIKRIRVLITPELASISGIALYSWIMLNNELNSKGYFIYDGNREEVYLSILETGDEELINKLEEYLNYKDEIARVAQLNSKFSNIIKEIMTLTDKDEIIEKANKFIENYMKLND
jgi:hypothetical protein